MLQRALALKLGFHPSTKAILVVISTSAPKWAIVGPWPWKLAEICNALVGLFCLYALETI